MMKVIQNFDLIDLQVKQECIKFLSCLKNLSETNTGIILTYNNLTATELQFVPNTADCNVVKTTATTRIGMRTSFSFHVCVCMIVTEQENREKKSWRNLVKEVFQKIGDICHFDGLLPWLMPAPIRAVQSVQNCLYQDSISEEMVGGVYPRGGGANWLRSAAYSFVTRFNGNQT